MARTAFASSAGYEAELGFGVGTPSALGRPVPVGAFAATAPGPDAIPVGSGEVRGRVVPST